MNAPTPLPCPTCERMIVWSAEFPWRPFCSERCKMVDLGAWLSESHAIPGEPLDETPVPFEDRSGKQGLL